ncbi:MAG: hypothetical protein RBR45_13595 [Pseudomonas sp.]|nr:hypothetical protein [Pseudomonas sp.]
MTDQPRDARFKVSADRSSARRKMRYVETNQGDADDCTLCQMDEQGTLADDSPKSNVTAQASTAQADDVIDDADDQFVEERLLEAIENQLSAQQPPAAQAVYNKLTLVGHTREDIVQMMAHVLAWQINEMLKAEQPFDMDAYECALRALPQLPDAP